MFEGPFPDPRRLEYEAMRRAGKPAKVALIAIARKLAIVANALVEANATYQNRSAAPRRRQSPDSLGHGRRRYSD
jgi:hypothetical protein